jgi:hypothetical protein
MPNCPVCGNNVQAGTQYCPACGTNLQQSFGAPTSPTPTPTPTPTYSPNYSYSQQGAGVPRTGQPHGHKRYVIAIIVALLIGLLVGVFIGASLPPPVDYTTLTGTVSLSSQYRGTADLIWFNSTIYGNGNLTAVVSANSCGVGCSYMVNLPTPDTYAVSIQWFNATGTPMFGTCNASPSTFSSNATNATQNFSC